jgi:uncharacterized protein YbaA (DUF1428 family)
MAYVDAYVLAVPKAAIEAYRAMATQSGAIWMEHGALSYVECFADDVPYGELTSFPRAVQAKEDEIVVVSWVTYESREARDAVNARVMVDPRLKMDPATMPFDTRRMIFGGFTPFVQL